jgi:hypothetical protein
VLDHIKLLGSFSVVGDQDRGYSIAGSDDSIQAGPWTEQGYPFFSGRGLYTTTFELASVDDALLATIEIPMFDDVVEVIVNGERAGVRLWDPYIIDVSKHVREGANELSLRVANTPANLLNGVTRPSGLADVPRLVMRSPAPEQEAGVTEGSRP